MADDTRIETLPSKEWNAEDGVFGGVIFTVTGAVYSVAEIGQIIAWLHAALSLSDLPTGIRVSNPVLEPITNGGRPVRPGTDIVAECKIYSTLGTERSDTVGPRSTTSGNCWSNILGNTVYVRGYPTARRAEHHTGMEVSLAVMIALANSRRLSRFKGLFCIKGFCSIILPTRLQEGLIFWHLVTNLDREYMSYTDHKILRLWASYPLGLSTEILETSRHILGWCDNIQNLAGVYDHISLSFPIQTNSGTLGLGEVTSFSKPVVAAIPDQCLVGNVWVLAGVCLSAFNGSESDVLRLTSWNKHVSQII